MTAIAQITSLHQQIKSLLPTVNNSLHNSLTGTDSLLTQLANGVSGSRDRGFNKLNADMAGLFGLINDTEMLPTLQATEAVANAALDLSLLMMKWDELQKQIKMINQSLQKAKKPILQ
jgi:hypothetical protein